jgi:WD40 repeat protein
MIRSAPVLLTILWVISGLLSLSGREPPSSALKSPHRQSPARRTDLYGDPLPAGAIARLGTVRFRNGHHLGSVAWSPDGKKLASCGIITGPISSWDAATGREIRRMNGAAVDSVIAWSPDGKMLASGNDDDNDPIHLWEVSTGKEVRQLVGHRETVDSLAWSSDGKILASGGSDGTISLWDVITGKEICRLGWQDIDTMCCRLHGPLTGRHLPPAVRTRRSVSGTSRV